MTIQVSSALKRNFLKINDQTSIYFCFIQFLLLCLHSQNPTPIRLSYVVFMFISSPLHISITFFSLLSPRLYLYTHLFFPGHSFQMPWLQCCIRLWKPSSASREGNTPSTSLVHPFLSVWRSSSNPYFRVWKFNWSFWWWTGSKHRLDPCYLTP